MEEKKKKRKNKSSQQLCSLFLSHAEMTVELLLCPAVLCSTNLGKVQKEMAKEEEFSSKDKGMKIDGDWET